MFVGFKSFNGYDTKKNWQKLQGKFNPLFFNIDVFKDVLTTLTQNPEVKWLL